MKGLPNVHIQIITKVAPKTEIISCYSSTEKINECNFRPSKVQQVKSNLEIKIFENHDGVECKS